MAVDEVRADLSLGRVLSLEWLVDSADEIFHVQLIPTDQDAPFEVRVEDSLKSSIPIERLEQSFTSQEMRYKLSMDEQKGTKLSFQYAHDDRWAPAVRAAVGDEWLLFVREEEGGKLFLVRAICLSHPRAFPSTAATTSKGELLANKTDIMRAVRRRVNLNRHVPAGRRRWMIDRWDREEGIQQWANEMRQAHPRWYWDPDDVAEMKGGFIVPIKTVAYWNAPTDPEDVDWDLEIVEAVVPADDEYLELLMEQLEQTQESQYRGAKLTSLYALLNYPREKTMPVISEIAKSKSRLRSDARRILAFLEYRDAPAHPRDKELLGRWDLLGKGERIELDFSKDHSCSVITVPLSQKASRYSRGKGFWIVRDGRLGIVRTEERIDDMWVTNHRKFFEPQWIQQISARRVVLENGLHMERP